MTADRESFELLRAIVQRPGNAVAQPIDRLAGSIRDWDSLLKLANEHRVLPMLFSRLAEMGPAVPPAVRDHLRAEYQRNMFHCTASAAELIGVLQAFERQAIPAMPFKGVVLSASIYGDFAQRQAGDLDVLIHPRHLPQATAILLERGYQLKTPVRADGAPIDPKDYEYHFERPADGMVLELRWRLSERGFTRTLDMDWVWPRRRVAILAGAEVPNLDPEIALLVLCMHGSKHAWARLNWICDVAQLLAAAPELDWKKATLEARRLGLWRTLAVGVLLAHRVAGAAVPQPVLRSFESDAAACRWVQFVQDNLFDPSARASHGRIPYYVQLLGLPGCAKWSLFVLMDYLQPNERDRAVLHLPHPLDALYYLVRPGRLLWDKLAR
jgi:hypothetical protein